MDFGLALERRLNKGRRKQVDRIQVAFIPTPRSELLSSLIKGRGDVIVANLTITPDRAAVVDFVAPIYSEAEEVLVTDKNAAPITSLDELAAKGVPLRRSSNCYEHIAAINEDCRAKSLKEIPVRLMDENLEDEDLLEMVNADLLDRTIVDRHTADIWASVFPRISIRPELKIASNGKIAWAIRKNSPRLKTVLDEFIKEHRVGTTFGNILKKKFYFGNSMVIASLKPHPSGPFSGLVAQ